jgi:hypothetical protein
MLITEAKPMRVPMAERPGRISAANFHSRALTHCALRQAWPVLDRLLHPGPWLAWRDYLAAIGMTEAAARMEREQIWPVPAIEPGAFDPDHFEEGDTQ